MHLTVALIIRRHHTSIYLTVKVKIIQFCIIADNYNERRYDTTEYNDDKNNKISKEEILEEIEIVADLVAEKKFLMI